MLKYLRKAPTLIVIGVTGFVGWPILTADRDSRPPKATAKPPLTPKPITSAGLVSLRDPFQVDRPPNTNSIPTSTSTPALAVTSTPALAVTSTPAVIPATGSPTTLASLKSGPKKGVMPELAQDEDKILVGMRLVGTFIDDREKLAVIDNKVYARGDQLRGANGDLLPYVVIEVRKDRALVRRGLREFVIAFSDAPRTAGPSTAAQSKGMAKAGTRANTVTTAKAKGPGVKDQPPVSSGDSKDLILQVLSGLGAPSAGSPPGAGSGTGGGLNPSTLGAGMNQNSISAGLDALMGKLDTIGRDGDGSTPSTPQGRTAP